MAARSHYRAVYGTLCPLCPTPHAILTPARVPGHAAVRFPALARLALHAASRRLLRAASRHNHNAARLPRYVTTRGLTRARARAWFASRASYLAEGGA